MATRVGEQGGAPRRVAAARAARLVGGDGVSGDGHALKNTREFDSDDGSVVSVSYGSSPDSLGVRSGDSSDDDAPRVRLARKSEPGLNAFESFRNELAAIDVEASLARGGPASKQSASAPTSPRGGGLRRERLEARDARSGPPRGLTLTQSASPQEELRWAQGPYTAQIGSARLGKTRADSVRGAAGSVRSVRSASARSERNHTSRTRATLPTGTYRDPARTFLRSGQGGAGMARGRSVAALEELADPAHAARLRRQLETAAGPAGGGARRAGQGGGAAGSRRRASARARLRRRTPRRARARRGAGRAETPRRGGSRAPCSALRTPARRRARRSAWSTPAPPRSKPKHDRRATQNGGPPPRRRDPLPLETRALASRVRRSARLRSCRRRSAAKTAARAPRSRRTRPSRAGTRRRRRRGAPRRRRRRVRRGTGAPSRRARAAATRRTRRLTRGSSVWRARRPPRRAARDRARPRALRPRGGGHRRRGNTGYSSSASRWTKSSSARGGAGASGRRRDAR